MQNTIEMGKRIQEIRNNLKMSQDKFSEALEISEVFLGQIERGERSLSINTLSKIVRYTGFSSDYILFGNEANNSQIDKINRILHKVPENVVKYIYKFILNTTSFIKTL